MQPRLSHALGLSACLLFAGSGLAQDAAQSALQFQAQLSGAQEVPAVNTQGSGTFSMQFGPAFGTAQHTFTVTGTNPVVAAHLHCAPAGVNGPIVLPLFQAQEPTPVDGTLSEGQVTNDNIQPTGGEEDGAIPGEPSPCPVTINNLASLYAAIRQGVIYANVHTPANPDGEIRGQIFPGLGAELGPADGGNGGGPGNAGGG